MDQRLHGATGSPETQPGTAGCDGAFPRLDGTQFAGGNYASPASHIHHPAARPEPATAAAGKSVGTFVHSAAKQHRSADWHHAVARHHGALQNTGTIKIVLPGAVATVAFRFTAAVRRVAAKILNLELILK